MISSTILNEVIDMHVRASEIKDLSRVMDLINQAKEYFKDNDINQWQKGYPDNTRRYYIRKQLCSF